MASYVVLPERASVDLAETPISSSNGASEPLLEEKYADDSEYFEPIIKAKPKQSRLAACTVLLFSCGIFVCSVVFYGFKYYTAPKDEVCQRRMWAGSPMQMGMEWGWRQYDSDIIPREYYGKATDERRETWKLIYDVTHQMHCVAFLRLFQHRYDWSFEDIMDTTEFIFHLHVNHYYLTLLTMIKCQADVTSVLFQKDDSRLGVRKTRDAPHRCIIFPYQPEIQHALVCAALAGRPFVLQLEIAPDDISQYVLNYGCGKSAKHGTQREERMCNVEVLG
ncbi:hypothetical protein DL769_003135 [Monosporascus sp. CRB-8-3]|nr:hypothetical protein DL769_003135 [Monosporascus sp. CRB-8-3]